MQRAKPITEVLKDHSGALLALPGVVGTALGLAGGRPCITVYVRQRTEELERLLPSTVEGYPVMLEETGEIRPL